VSAQGPGAGCRFEDRCPRRLGDICATTPPPALRLADGHVIHCHIPVGDLTAISSP
jgi:peptide/nickel transport system ATP-binding protein